MDLTDVMFTCSDKSIVRTVIICPFLVIIGLGTGHTDILLSFFIPPFYTFGGPNGTFFPHYEKLTAMAVMSLGRWLQKGHCPNGVAFEQCPLVVSLMSLLLTFSFLSRLVLLDFYLLDLSSLSLWQDELQNTIFVSCL